MPTEIIWTPENDDTPELLPGRVVRVVQMPRDVRIEFTGHDEFGRRYEGILQIRLRFGVQRIAGKQRYELEIGKWQTAEFSVTGEFMDGRFEVFEGKWFEPEGRCLVGVYGLPASKLVAAKKRATQRKQGIRRTS